MKNWRKDPYQGHGFSRAEEAMLSDRLQPLGYGFSNQCQPPRRTEKRTPDSKARRILNRLRPGYKARTKVKLNRSALAAEGAQFIPLPDLFRSMFGWHKFLPQRFLCLSNMETIDMGASNKSVIS